MKNINLIAIWNGLAIANFGYQYFATQNWYDAAHASVANATALFCVYLARKASKP